MFLKEFASIIDYIFANRRVFVFYTAHRNVETFEATFLLVFNLKKQQCKAFSDSTNLGEFLSFLQNDGDKIGVDGAQHTQLW